MAEGRARLEWAQSSAMMAMMGNAAGGKKGGGSFHASDFDPYADEHSGRGRGGRGIPITPHNIEILKRLLPSQATGRKRQRGIGKPPAEGVGHNRGQP
jgi:hypothetical protein